MRVVADSSSDLYTFEGLDFKSVPMKIITKEKEFVDVEGIDIVELVETLKTTTEKTSTSCPNSYDWMEAFGDADEVIALTITSQLSGSYNSAMQAAQDFVEENPERKVHVIDTLSTGPEMRLIVEKIRELAENGEIFEKILSEVEEYRKHTHLIFCLESMINLARNGRVSPLLAKITEAIGIRFIGRASDQGTLQQMTVARGAKKTPEKIFGEMKKLGFNGGKCRITHILNPEAAEKLKELVLKEFPHADTIIAACTGLCTYYAEDGGLLVGFEG